MGTPDEIKKWEEELEKLNKEVDPKKSNFEQMELLDKMHVLQMKIQGTKPGGQYFECVNCGS
jgi:hypothetical protein